MIASIPPQPPPDAHGQDAPGTINLDAVPRRLPGNGNSPPCRDPQTVADWGMGRLKADL